MRHIRMQRRWMALRDKHYCTHVTIEAWRLGGTPAFQVVACGGDSMKDKRTLGSGKSIGRALSEAESRPVPGSKEAQAEQAAACVEVCKQLSAFSGARGELGRFARAATTAWHAVPALPTKSGGEEMPPLGTIG